jgi:hypothetical protein
VVGDVSTQSFGDFQTLHRAVNLAKREHCKRCKRTGKMFNARQLGFPIPTLTGKLEWSGSCSPCYWYGPPEFVKEVCAKIQRGDLYTHTQEENNQ